MMLSHIDSGVNSPKLLYLRVGIVHSGNTRRTTVAKFNGIGNRELPVKKVTLAEILAIGENTKVGIKTAKMSFIKDGFAHMSKNGKFIGMFWNKGDWNRVDAKTGQVVLAETYVTKAGKEINEYTPWTIETKTAKKATCYRVLPRLAPVSW